MSEEEKPQYFADLERYQFGNVASMLYNDEKDVPFAKGALEKLVSSFDIDKDILEGLKAGTFASEEGIKTASQIYAGKYRKTLASLKVSEFYEVRFPTLKSLLGEAKTTEAQETFEKYAEQTVGLITKKVAQAQAILNDQTELFDEEKKAGAKKTLEKFAPIFNLIQILEKRKYDELRLDAMKPTYKDMITETLGNIK